MRSTVLLVLCFVLCLSSVVSDASTLTNKARHVRAPMVDDPYNGTPLKNPSDNKVISYDLGHYFFYYGNKFASGTESNIPGAVQQYMTDISGSSYLDIMSQYSGPVGTNATNKIHWVGQSVVGTPFGTSIGGTPETCAFHVLEKLIFDAGLGVAFDATVQYYVIFGDDITIVDDKTGCADGGFCGVHNELKRTINGAETRYYGGWVQDNPDGCVPTQIVNLPTPNADIGVQNVLNTLSHEVSETITDPNQIPGTARAWNDDFGFEIGDKCNHYFQPIYASTKKPGSYYNFQANGNEYMLQSEWSNEINGCATSRGVTNPSAAATIIPGSTLSTTPSAAASPPNFGPLPSSACITCPRVCKRYRKFKNVCGQRLGGNFTHPVSDQLCCDNITGFSSFSWSVNAINCEYGPPAHKLSDLCVALGGRVSCSIGVLGAVRLTCNH